MNPHIAAEGRQLRCSKNGSIWAALLQQAQACHHAAKSICLKFLCFVASILHDSSLAVVLKQRLKTVADLARDTETDGLQLHCSCRVTLPSVRHS